MKKKTTNLILASVILGTLLFGIKFTRADDGSGSCTPLYCMSVTECTLNHRYHKEYGDGTVDCCERVAYGQRALQCKVDPL